MYIQCTKEELKLFLVALCEIRLKIMTLPFEIVDFWATFEFLQNTATVTFCNVTFKSH